MNEFQIEYLISALEDVEKVQAIILQKQINENDSKEVFRVIHSIKGSGASCDLYFLSTICHQFEEFLTHNTLLKIDENGKDTILKFIDLLTFAIGDYTRNDHTNFEKYKNILSKLQQTSIAKEYYAGSALIVDGTNTMTTLLTKILEEKGYKCSVAKNGLAGFNRLVVEKFDILLTSLNLDAFDGVSLTTAIKSTININSNIPVVVLSASTNVLQRFPDHSKPEFILQKDNELIKNLLSTIDKIFNIDKQTTQNSKGPKKILYIEDDPKMQKLFKLSILKQSGVEVEIADNMESAIKKCSSFKPDVLIIDQFLGQEKGEDIFAALLDKSIQTIFLTGSEGSIPVDRLSIHKEFKGIITKPFRPATIYNQICQFYK